MVEARLAPVRPRVRPLQGGAVRLLEEEVQGFLDQHQTGSIALVGPAGSGKTTALAHLAAVLSPRPLLFDHVESVSAVPSAAVPPKTLLIYARRLPWAAPHLAKFELVPWERDDAIEYLLARHKDHCASVMRR